MSKLKVFIITDKNEGTVRVTGHSQNESTIGKVTDKFRSEAFEDAKANGGGAYSR